MSEQVRAAVVEHGGAKPSVQPIDLADPAPDEVLVRIEATGICHTDVAWAAGDLFDDFPVVLGHESAGTVSATGDAVTRFQPGDRVVLALAHHCGHCFYCETGRPMLCPDRTETRPRLSRGGEPLVQGFGTAGFAEATVVKEATLVPVPDGVPFEVAALMGCAVATGVGAAVNLAAVQPGSTVLVLGAGGIGASVVMGARLAGAERIVVVEPVELRRELAERVGATDTFAPDEDRILGLESDGFDYAFETTGRVDEVDLSIRAVRPGGTSVLIGIPALGTRGSFELIPFIATQKRILGCITGNVRPNVDIPAWSRLYLRGLLPLDAMVTGSVPLDEIADGFARSDRAEGVRTLVKMS